MMSHRPSAQSLVALTCVAALAAACTQQAAEPAAAPSRTPAAAPVPPAPVVNYACESGKTVAVQYPDTATAQITYQNQTYALRTAAASTGVRFAGSGVEWWTVNRDGQESATLSRLGPDQAVGATVLERCSRPTPVPGVPTGPSPLPTPAPGGVLLVSPPCRSAQLKLTAEGGDAGMGNRVTVLGLQNTGPVACSLTGYPTVTLLDGRGRSLTAIRSEQSPGNYFHSNTAPKPVELAPAALAPNAKAYFDMAWNVVPHEGAGETACPTATTVRLLAPGETGADNAPATLAQTFTPCGGRIRISPVRPVAEDTPPT